MMLREVPAYDTSTLCPEAGSSTGEIWINGQHCISETAIGWPLGSRQGAGHFSKLRDGVSFVGASIMPVLYQLTTRQQLLLRFLYKSSHCPPGDPSWTRTLARSTTLCGTGFHWLLGSNPRLTAFHMGWLTSQAHQGSDMNCDELGTEQCTAVCSKVLSDFVATLRPRIDEIHGARSISRTARSLAGRG